LKSFWLTKPKLSILFKSYSTYIVSPLQRRVYSRPSPLLSTPGPIVFLHLVSRKQSQNHTKVTIAVEEVDALPVGLVGAHMHVNLAAC
jgi:hypothetical protein